MPIIWNDVKKHLRDWVYTASASSSVPTVIWDRQGAPKPTYPYIALRLTVPRPVGRDWVDVEDAGVTPGEEIAHRARGSRTAVFSITCFATDEMGPDGAEAVIGNILNRRALPSQEARLDKAGAGLSSFGTPISAGGVVGGTRIQPQATVDVNLIMASEVSELGTYIEFVELINTIEGSVIGMLPTKTLFAQLDLAVDGGTADVNVDYTVPTSQKATVKRVVGYLSDTSGTLTMAKWGSQSALTTGIRVIVVNVDGTTEDLDFLGSGNSLKTNADLMLLTGGNGFEESGALGYGFVWDFAAADPAGEGIELAAAEKLRFIVGDDMTALTGHAVKVMLQGSIDNA